MIAEEDCLCYRSFARCPVLTTKSSSQIQDVRNHRQHRVHEAAPRAASEAPKHLGRGRSQLHYAGKLQTRLESGHFNEKVGFL